MVKRVIATILLITLASANAWAGSERIAFPSDYRSKMENYLSLDRTQDPDQIIRLFASKETLDAAKGGGKLPNGTVIVAEVYKAKKDKDGNVIESALGKRIRGKFAAVAVMKKGKGWGADFPKELRNGDWDFAIFKPTGERLVKKDLNKCRGCHAPLADTQHLFSFEHLAR